MRCAGVSAAHADAAPASRAKGQGDRHAGAARSWQHPRALAALRRCITRRTREANSGVRRAPSIFRKPSQTALESSLFEWSSAKRTPRLAAVTSQEPDGTQHVANGEDNASQSSRHGRLARNGPDNAVRGRESQQVNRRAQGGQFTAALHGTYISCCKQSQSETYAHASFWLHPPPHTDQEHITPDASSHAYAAAQDANAKVTLEGPSTAAQLLFSVC